MGDIKVMACIGVTEGEINGAPVLWRLDIFLKKIWVAFFLKGRSENFFRLRSRKLKRLFYRNNQRRKRVKKVFLHLVWVFFSRHLNR
jgi:hypothetical protein